MTTADTDQPDDANLARASRARAIALVLVAARRDGQDMGELIGAAAQDAAKKLVNGPADLVCGRPGSWEASILIRWAAAGGWVDPPTHVIALSKLLQQAAHAGDDGGGLLSQAMGQAVDELGSMAVFVGASGWETQLRKMGGQYASADGSVDGRWDVADE